MTSDRQERAGRHYQRLAARFEENWAYSPAFVEWMTSQLVKRLNPCPGEWAADVGCGTGLYSRGLAERTRGVACVDPCGAMLAQLPTDPALVPVRASLEDLAMGSVWMPRPEFEVVLAKEVLHHAAGTGVALRTLASLVAPGGRLLLVLLAPKLDYPLFAAALERYGRHPADTGSIAAQLAACGLHSEVSTASFPLTIGKDRWLEMVADRWMSLLSKFDDVQLAAGIAEIDATYSGPVLEFDDSFVFVLARRLPHPRRPTPARR
ncbi:methyltransferase domain-containing protein [Actinomadura darangshiensis]|uniref:Methyltransferase domain-containing protein n=1 Tax=Actinomadura darangshiensis TaxID=705336 RepID=A0A4R4ZW63_9ACTN|nr:methyltransferase domain-containing protein [Actinomadura darangshiensis]TDD62596.1 methyltransferase domain-containing protein [Actinomadura darangshiensis]